MNEKEEYTFETVWKSIQELSEKLKKTDEIVNGIAKSNGDMAEQTIYNSLERDMTFAGVEFEDIDKNRKRKSKSLKLEGEYDVVMENGNTIAIIETKYKVRKKDVSELLTQKLDSFRKLFPYYSDYKILLGVGGMSFDDDAIKEAKENGIGIIKIIGDKVEYHTEGIKTY